MKSDPAPTTLPKAHVALNVRDTEASGRFYRGLFGVEPAKVRDGYVKFDVEDPPLNLSLNRAAPTAGSEAPRRLSHLGIQVASSEEVARVRNRWREAGLETREEIGTNCCYAIQDKAWARDPDGNEWEVFVVLEDNLTSTSACCGAVPEGLVSIG
jgi:catechol 2,3-dioxygenase-like lactoylglutathione lyase family enzyme